MADRKLLGIYLNDHLTGAAGGVELARRLASNWPDQDERGRLSQLADEIAADKEQLVAIMRSVGVQPSRVRQLLGQVGERIGRLKLNGHLITPSPLSPLIEVEAMRVGVQGKAGGWRTLRNVAEHEERLDVGQFDELLRRADRQLEVLEDLRQAAVRQADYLRG